MPLARTRAGRPLGRLSDRASSGVEVWLLFGCGAGAVDLAWCPTARKNHQSDPPDYVGVYIKFSHSYFTGFFGAGPKIMTDKTVMRIEPTDA